MKKIIGVFEAKTHLPKFIDAVLRGETITITRRGQEVAILAPITEEEKAKKNIQSAISNLRTRRKGISWGKGMSTKSAKEEGRR